MSSRKTLRRKVVLAVTVVRHGGQEKQLAHTLDVTEDSARLGGLAMSLQPGETVEIQRGPLRAKFQVFWMGAPGSSMAGQAGVRSLAQKPIWGVNLPAEEVDKAVDTGRLRREAPPVRTAAQLPGEKRWHTRYECSGSVAIKMPNASFPVNGEVKDICQGGVYVEMTSPMPVKSEVILDLCVENIAIEAKGIVRTSYPMVGMGINFSRLSAEDQEKLTRVLEKLRKRAAGEASADQPAASPWTTASRVLSREPQPARAKLHLEARVLAAACQALASDFDSWRNARPVTEVEELRQAISRLQQKFSAKPQVELLDYLAAVQPRGGIA